MPKVDGFELLRQLKSDAELRSIPVFVLSSSDEPADVERALALGAHEYLNKGMSAGYSRHRDEFELPDSGIFYRGPREVFRAVVSELVAFYEQYRLEIVMQLSANSIERMRMRTGAMRAFADAFLIGKRNKDG